MLPDVILANIFLVSHILLLSIILLLNKLQNKLGKKFPHCTRYFAKQLFMNLCKKRNDKDYKAGKLFYFYCDLSIRTKFDIRVWTVKHKERPGGPV